MGKIITCKICKQEKPHKGHGLCKNCHQKEISKQKNICSCCLVLKPVYRKNPVICFKCYHKHNKKELCSKCGEKCVPYVKNPLLCKSCYRPPTILCSNCKENRSHKAKGLCNKCYGKYHMKHSVGICKSCNGKTSIVAGLCGSCRHKKRNEYEVCAFCNKKKIISKWTDSKPICSYCDRLYNKLGYCKKCKQVKPLFSLKSKICCSCYNPPKRKCDLCNKYDEIAKIGDNQLICRKCYCKLPERRGKSIRGAAPITGEEWLFVMKTNDWKCFYCNTKLQKNNRTIDHIIPIIKGGSNNLSNLIPCCRHCNSSKNDSDVLDWINNNNIKINTNKTKFLMELTYEYLSSRILRLIQYC